MMLKKYCESVFKTRRFKTREVMIGNIGVGGPHPLRIQSMTTSNTRDVGATVNQIMKLADCGCEIARVTVQGIKEAEACEAIKSQLIQRGYTIPLVADIHFFPPAAMRVVDFVDKVRVNPGNFVDKRASFKVLEFDEVTYAKEIEKIEEKFTPLVEKCKKLKRAMRIGTNHGSLSDRIMSRYGDTPEGMVESAFEFARICIKNEYHDIIFSMKSSNPQVMIQAYRLLVARMKELGWNYPLHLGVTEAGQGEDGRIKSAMGIGALLLDGLGDTLRVSLTEDAWHEIDPCRRLASFAESYLGRGVEPFEETFRNFCEIQRRPVSFPPHIALHRDGTVMVGVDSATLQGSHFYRVIGCDEQFGQPKIKALSADVVVLKDSATSDKLQVLHQMGIGFVSAHPLPGAVRLLSLDEAAADKRQSMMIDRFNLTPGAKETIPIAIRISDEDPTEWSVIQKVQPAFILLKPSTDRLHPSRRFFEWLHQQGCQIPVILNFSYTCSKEDLVIQASAECGALLCDGLGDGLWIEGPYEVEFLRHLSFGILQAARRRSSKTDFISCPSCGRTLFDLQTVSARIRARTAHLPGVKIAIMGCVVNGPGEMADADFGYVGSKPGKIDLYVGRTCVERDIDFAEGDDRLIALIKSHGRWKEPEQ